MKHYLTKYFENGTQYAESWLQLNLFGMAFCFWRKRIEIGERKGRYIDADNLMKALEEDIPITDNPIEVMASVIATLEEQPTADVVEVVRCKDCKYGEVDNVDFPDQYFCNHHGCAWNEDHFCSYGERAEE